MSGGPSFSSGKGSTQSGFGDILGSIAEKINKETDPVRKMFLSQMKQVLGGNQFTNSTIPLIQSGVAAARQAGAASSTQAKGYEATSGVAQSPFSAAINSVIAQGTNQNIGAVPGQVSGQILGEVPGTISSMGSLVNSGLTGAAQFNNSSSQSQFGATIPGLSGDQMQGMGVGISSLLAA